MAKKPQKAERKSRRTDYNLERPPLQTGKKQGGGGFLSFFSSLGDEDVRRFSTGTMVLFLVLALLVAMLILEYVTDGIVSYWIRRMFPGD